MNKILKEELKRCVLYFKDNTNYDDNSWGYGLTKDKYPSINNVASIAASGYSLAIIPISITNDWLDYDIGYDMALKTLKTIYNLENINGFYYHYINYDTGKRELNSEISIIDTSILLCGVLCVGEFFGREVLELSQVIYDRVKWTWFVDKKVNMFYLGYKNKFYGHWDNYAEQLIMYVLGSGSNTYPIDKVVYYSFKRNVSNDIIYSWFGSLFTYQYSHAWLNFKDLRDELDTDWYINSYNATMANKKYCLSLNNKTFKKGYWGLSATITDKRYSQRLGAEPCMSKIKSDGTISLSSLISSVIFDLDIPNLMNKLYLEYPSSFGKYGFVTSLNLGKKEPWYCSEYLGIDKGNTMLMLSNYFDKTIWNIMMDNIYVKQGLKILNIK